MSRLAEYLLPTLIQRFPVFDPRWGDVLRSRWMDNYEQLWRAVIAEQPQKVSKKAIRRRLRHWDTSIHAHTSRYKEKR